VDKTERLQAFVDSLFVPLSDADMFRLLVLSISISSSKELLILKEKNINQQM
jgi:hypothetical protein